MGRIRPAMTTHSDQTMPTRLPKLEELCDRCFGAGGSTECDEWDDCAVCGGAGYIATADGKIVLALMRHNQKNVNRGERESRR